MAVRPCWEHPIFAEIVIDGLAFGVAQIAVSLDDPLEFEFCIGGSVVIGMHLFGPDAICRLDVVRAGTQRKAEGLVIAVGICRRV